MRRTGFPFALGCAVALFAGDLRPAPANAGPPASATPPLDVVPELDAAAHAMASDRALGGASVGIAILDVDSGRMLAAVNEHLALNPASNAKLYTAGAALATLHGEHRYETTLSGNLEGDAVRVPRDPRLRRSVARHRGPVVARAGAEGVRGHAGRRGHPRRPGFYDDQTTPPAFEQQPNEWASFRAPVSAVALDENCVTMTVRPSSGGNARVDFDPPGFVDVDGTIHTSSSGGADTVELALSRERRAPLREGERRRSRRTRASSATRAAPTTRGCSPATRCRRCSRRRA